MGRTVTQNRDDAVNDPYVVRKYDPDDLDGVLALDEAVWGRTRDVDWFTWKYVENPYLDETPVFVAERDGEIVGARPFLVFRMRAGDRTALALQPADTMVHPDHRRRGLFTRMTSRAIDYYDDREPAFFFNFPNESAQPGYLKLGWRTAGTRTTYYRVQNPDAFLTARVDGPLGHVVGRLATPFARGYCSVRDRLADSVGEFSVERRGGVLTETLTRLYGRNVPPEIHAQRDETLYGWRFASPAWTRTTYLACRDGEPVAGLLTRTRRTYRGITVTQFADVVPMVGGPAWEAALSHLFEAALADHTRSDLLSAPESRVPHDLFTSYGFHRDDAPPYSRLKNNHRSIVTRPLGDTDEYAWSFNGRQLTHKADWLLSYAERDTT